jgi:hypothetical protein
MWLAISANEVVAAIGRRRPQTGVVKAINGNSAGGAHAAHVIVE